MDLVLVSHTVILLFLVVTAIVSISLNDLFAAVVVYSAYSFCMCLTYLILRSPDVAMTEAAVGAGVSTILFITALAKTSRKEDE